MGRGVSTKVSRSVLSGERVEITSKSYLSQLHREEAIVKNWKPFNVEMPAIYNIIDNDKALKKHNILQPRLYDLGFTHNNCAGRCVKAGQKHFRTLRETRPEVFYKLLEQEHYLKICVSAYRYITNKKCLWKIRFLNMYKNICYKS